uniref:Nucleotide-diphospho-sugar transferase domain-containing protein n=1 Tax=Haptolina ericina TaxID=156174 RepID=A0A7S3ANP3_9EUKA|mmetsp:Transcript_27945/g.63205  ORF Transcript_27945/g.63205 Transcript_27945/m.63205 type:complete len:403 (+) Transcript_27945:77-1285(+)
MNLSSSLSTALRRAAGHRNDTVILFTAVYPSARPQVQVSMGEDTLLFLQAAIRNLQSLGHYNQLVLTEQTHAPQLCAEVVPTCGFQTPIIPHVGWQRFDVNAHHYFVLFLQRWRLIKRATARGYQILSLDTDIFWTGDPYIHVAQLPVAAAFAADMQPPLHNGTTRIPLNSGVMLARPGAQSLFAEVTRRVHARLLSAPNRTAARDTADTGMLMSVLMQQWVMPQWVLNEVVRERQTSSWVLAPRPIGYDSGSFRGRIADSTAIATVGTARVAVLSHNIIGRLCGRRLGHKDTTGMWRRASLPNCTLASSQLGFHAQMVHPKTREALWGLLHPVVREQAAARRLLSSAMNSSASGFESVAFSSTRTAYSCICAEDGDCRVLDGRDSFRVSLKRCRTFDPGAR